MSRLTETYCPVCGRRDSWGCGHTGAQRRKAERHNRSVEHLSGACHHYNHAGCDPATCERAGDDGAGPGFFPNMTHEEARAFHAEGRS